MQFPKLTPLQSRFAATFVATVILVVIYLTISPHHFAYAAGLDSASNDDYRSERFLESRGLAEGRIGESINTEENNDLLYESEFIGVDRGIIGRADDGSTSLSNNIANNKSISPGSTNFYTFPNASVFGVPGVKGAGLPSKLVATRSISSNDRSLDGNDIALIGNSVGSSDPETQNRQAITPSRTVYISINVCSQPSANGTSSSIPPQLTLYVSRSADNRKPGPDTTDRSQTMVLHEGYADYTLNATGDVYLSVHAPTTSESISGQWSYNIAASIDAPYHAYNEESPFLFLVDSDTNSALFVTNNLTQTDSSEEEFQKWMETGTPFTMFAFDSTDPAIRGMRNSYCGLHQVFAKSNMDIEAGMTTRGLGNKPKEQFLVQGLKGSSSYAGILAMRGNSTHDASDVPNGDMIGGGGQVWRSVDFSTKTDGNCQLIFNLTFCSEVAYAVPSNPNNYNTSSLAQLYDNFTSEMYQNFNYSLQQIPCNTTSTAQYSLARNCTDCANDYKNWLCAVTIPRCEDFSSDADYLQPRNVGSNFLNGSILAPDSIYVNSTMQKRIFANSSRNPLIDEKVQPGPYKEVLPCEDLCYSLVQSCPAQLGFGCPLRGLGLERSYGRRSTDGSLTCSYLGAVYYRSSSIRGITRSTAIMRPILAAWAFLLLLN